MAETCLSVRWKDHSNELTALCKIFLEKDHLVDCTLSAEGHSLKVHRMILSACSPYFRTLFSGEKEKNPIVVLFDASFETLKAVIDFVYCGEAKIPQKNLKAFLSLAQLLQIKGPIAFTEKDGNEGVSGVSAGNVSSRLSEDPGGYNEVQGPSANPEDSVEDHSLFFSGGFTDEQSRTHNACSDACENVQLGSVVPPQPGQQINPECDELAIETEISVKSEPLFSGFFETKRELLDNVKNDEPKPGNVPIEMAKESAPVFDQEVLRPSPSGGEFSLAHVESTTQPQLHLLQEQQSESQQQLQQQQHSQLLNENLPGSVAEQPQPLLPVILVPKSEQPDDAVWEESMDSQDVLERDTNEETEPAFGEQNVNQSSSRVGQWPSAMQVEGRKLPRRHRCFHCHKTFHWPSKLRAHMRIHMWDRVKNDTGTESASVATIEAQRLTTPSTPTEELSKRLSGNMTEHVLETIPSLKKKYPTRVCKVCKAHKRRGETRYMCNGCGVPLHKGDCFIKYHTLEHY